MQNYLNLTLKLKQDAASQAGVAQLVSTFDAKLKPTLDQVFPDSQIVHFARFLMIGTEYLQIITVFDGDSLDYAMFFWNKLNAVFEAAYTFVENAPSGDDWNVDNFIAFNRIPGNQPVPFYFYSAYPDKTVKIINATPAAAVSAPASAGVSAPATATART